MSTQNKAELHEPSTKSGWVSRWKFPILAVIALVVIAVSGLFILNKDNCLIDVDSHIPQCTPLPANITLTRTEDLITDHIRYWYYIVPHFSPQGIVAFYKSQLPQVGWKCISSMESTNISQNGQPITGIGEYITAIRGQTKLQINSGSQEYGQQLLQDDLPDGAVSLEIFLEPAQGHNCS